jgi:hypothetical protein
VKKKKNENETKKFITVLKGSLEGENLKFINFLSVIISHFTKNVCMYKNDLRRSY